MDKTISLESVEPVGWVTIPDSLHREGQFIVNLVGNCLSTRPATPLYDGDKLLIHPIPQSELKCGEVIVMNTSFGLYTKEYIRKMDNFVLVRQYHPAMQIGVIEDEVIGTYRVDAILRNGIILKIANTEGHC